ncbi:hypothetical protein KIN20_030253 [Parelaphostrongylus tenuis]|uniref:Uncharacterized protein n=1 Tax=Parelaphostrongylus tenuis TaxID=148309 RepID=A0AAD5R3T7_PARTN|nr:hypothetical protein KIN20_030253 [Parelaphostrongylus tenuis]
MSISLCLPDSLHGAPALEGIEDLRLELLQLQKNFKIIINHHSKQRLDLLGTVVTPLLCGCCDETSPSMVFSYCDVAAE